jgi:hypothetical protein
MRRRLTYSNVIATVALFAALGGSSYAAISLPKNSVGPKQIRSNAISTKQVKDGSLLSRDFKAGQLPAGPTGPIGPQGPKGETGAPGNAIAYARVIVTAGDATVDPAQSKGVTDANVTRIDKGVTCFTRLGFAPKSIIATADIGAGGGGLPLAGGALAPSTAVTTTCGAGGQAAIATTDPANPITNIDASYFVVFE